MALLTALFSFLGKKATDLLQVILGWSVTAIFGRLSNAKQTIFSGILLASLAWPLLVAGVFLPPIASWTFAAAPVHQWVGASVVRVIATVLAVVLPALIGLVVHYTAPRATQKGGVVRCIVGGYPLTLGFALACIITVFSVGVLKVRTLAKRWDDEHVYAQPLPERYDDAVQELREACVRAGDADAIIEPVSGFMALPTRVLRFFARGTLDALVDARPKRVRAASIELYLYPGDLLFRGKTSHVARVRAELSHTKFARVAYLVAEKASQDLQKQIDQMWNVLARYESPDRIGGLSRGRIQEIADDLRKAEIPYDEWFILTHEFDRLEKAFGGGTRLPTTREESGMEALPFARTSPEARR